MEHPWVHWLRFRKSQLEGPCEDHVCYKRAIFWTFLGKAVTGYTHQCEIWHGTSLSTLIKIQEEPIWRTMWGPCFGNKVVIFWPHLRLLNHWVVKWKTGHSCRPLVLLKVGIVFFINFFLVPNHNISQYAFDPYFNSSFHSLIIFYVWIMSTSKPDKIKIVLDPFFARLFITLIQELSSYEKWLVMWVKVLKDQENISLT